MSVPILPAAPPSAAADIAPPDSREALMKFLDRESAIARATDGRLAILLLELRRVDRLHALLKGPSAAVTMALVLERLRKALRREDRVAALSDEQVCIVLPRLAHPSQAVLAAVKMLRALDRPIAHEGGSAVLRPCIGVATLPEHGFAPAELLMAADVSRHIAATREEGYHVFQAEDAVETEVYRGLDLDLERAIRANELELHYQPQVALPSGRPVGAEALLRWTHAAAGEVDPATTVGIAERTGMMGALTFWVLNAALRQAAQWHAAGFTPRIAINLSAGMLIDRELPAVVDQSLKTWGVPARYVTLEIAESSVIAEAERSAAILTRLKAVGLQIAIDDFGSGFTSLAQLKRCPIDVLKIDKPFIAGMLTDPGDRAVVRSAVDIAHHFGMLVSAEGVERSDIGEALAAFGCDLAQGNAICPPLTEPQFREWWGAHAPAADRSVV